MKKILSIIFVFTLFLSLGSKNTANAINLRSALRLSLGASLEFHLTGGKVTSINGGTLTVTNDNKTFTVNTDSNTKVIRRYGGIGTVSEISVNDHINIAGNWTDSNKTTILAHVIRDGSIQERHDAFQGTVTSVNSSGFVLSSKNRGSQTVVVTSDTKFTSKSGAAITQGSIVVGNTVVLDGLWDRATTTVTATRVRDLSL